MTLTATGVVALAKSVSMDVSSLRSRMGMLGAAPDAAMRSRVLQRTDDLIADLDLLAGHDAQVVVGAAVTSASQAVQLLRLPHRPPGAATTMPTEAALDGVQALLKEYADIAKGWAARA